MVFPHFIFYYTVGEHEKVGVSRVGRYWDVFCLIRATTLRFILPIIRVFWNIIMIKIEKLFCKYPHVKGQI